MFQGRYKAILVQKESYLLELARYIVLNPVRAGMVRSEKEWPWSSYRATVGQSKGIDCLNVDWLLSAFGPKRKLAIERYKVFVSEGKRQPSPWRFLKGQVFLGNDQFIEEMQALIDEDKELSEVPSSQRRPVPCDLVYYEASNTDRNSAIKQAYLSGGYTLKQLGDYFGLHYSTVSGIVNTHKSKT